MLTKGMRENIPYMSEEGVSFGTLVNKKVSQNTEFGIYCQEVPFTLAVNLGDKHGWIKRIQISKYTPEDTFPHGDIIQRKMEHNDFSCCYSIHISHVKQIGHRIQIIFKEPQ